MTVAELIAELEKLEPTLEVFLRRCQRLNRGLDVAGIRL